MKIDFSQPMLSIAGQPIADGGGVLTLRAVVVSALQSQGDNTPETAQRRFLLAQRIQAAEAEVSLTSEEASEAKGVVAQSYKPLVAGQACILLDGEPHPIVSAPLQPDEMAAGQGKAH